MVGRGAASDRSTFEQLVSSTAWRPESAGAVHAELERQKRYQPRATSDGLQELAALLARRFAGDGSDSAAAVDELTRAYSAQPLVHLYAFALHREAGDERSARASLDALLVADPDDPIAVYFDGFLRSRSVTPAPEDVRLANIARFATTPLLKNPYSLAVGLMFEAIREREQARVLDIGVGGGAQMAGLVGLLGALPHRVRRLEIVGLDFNPVFLARAEERIAATANALGGRVEVAYRPVEGRVEALDPSTCEEVSDGGLDAANASIALHEVPGESKLAALSNVRRIAPARFVIAEWNYCLENVLPETSVEFVFNVRRVAAAMVASLAEDYSLEQGRAAVRDWLSQGAGQLTCPSEERQECFLDVGTWKALLEHSGFDVVSPEQRWLEHAAEPSQAAIADEGWYVRTSNYAGATPIALLVGAPR
jgi:ubiquinone/menaquinone biosynthesis C-methylase UbiE